MSKFSLKFAFVFIWLLVILGQTTTAQETITENPLAFLKPLVGKKCAVHLKNGKVIKGTLWVYGTDYVSVKVKKGLLYSKTEKYYASEIDFLKDKAANRYYMPRVDRPANEKFATKVVSNPDKSVAEEESKLEQEFQGTFRFVSKKKEKRESTLTSSSPKTPYEKTKLSVANRTKTILNNKTEKPRTALSNRPGKAKTVKPNLYSARPKEAKKEVRKPAKPTYFTKRTPAKRQVMQKKKSGSELPKETKQQTQQSQTRELKTVAAASDSQKPGYLSNKRIALLGSGVLIIAALFLFKVVRVKYRKQTLFPTRVIEIQGKFAVIDHGETDGIKTDDIIRLYKKTGSQIQYKGKIKVKKVGENYSAVEVTKLQPGQELEISDVGFRNRNHFALALKRFRIILSSSLHGLARGIQFTAKNIEVKFDPSQVDLKPSDEKLNNDVRTVVPQKHHVVRVTPEPVTTVKSFNNSRPWEFGGE